jgi:hypothetical protein
MPMKALKSDDPAMQGEGNYIAARRHRRSAEAYVAGDKVHEAARRAAPRDTAEAAELKAAEARGRARGRH